MISPEAVLYSSYIKYSKLTEIINKEFIGCESSNCNLYIDLYSVFKPLYDPMISIKDSTMIPALVMNLCAHYREFFRKVYSTEINIYLVYSPNAPYNINNKLYKGYNSDFENKYTSNSVIRDIINQGIRLLDIFIPYIHGIYFIHSHSWESGVIIKEIINRNKNKSYPNIVITKDPYNYQLVNDGECMIIRAKKGNKGDTSYSLNMNDCVYKYVLERKVKFKPTISISPGLLPLIMTLSGLKARSVKSIYNISKSIRLIETGIKEYKFNNGSNYDIDSLINNIILLSLDTNLNEALLNHKYKALSIQYLHSIYVNSPACKSLKFLDLYDPETVKKICNQYFIKYPIHLNEL